MSMTMATLGEQAMRQYPAAKRRFNILGGKIQGRPRELATRRGKRRSRPRDLSKLRRIVTGQTRKLLETGRKGAMKMTAASIRTGPRPKVQSIESFKSYTKSLVSSFKGR